jgi:hypothetical protein
LRSLPPPPPSPPLPAAPLSPPTHPLPARSYTFFCKGVPNQAWQWFPENGTIASADGGGTCLTVGYAGDPGRGVVGTLITTDVCDPALPPTQVFSWDPARSQIKHVGSGNCVDAGHLGQLVRYDPSRNPDAAWSLDRVRANTCPDPGNPPFLPRASLRDYTVGVGSVDGADRLVILDGDGALGGRPARSAPRAH